MTSTYRLNKRVELISNYMMLINNRAKRNECILGMPDKLIDNIKLLIAELESNHDGYLACNACRIDKLESEEVH